jgi:hypothetical protein
MVLVIFGEEDIYNYEAPNDPVFSRILLFPQVQIALATAPVLKHCSTCVIPLGYEATIQAHI